MLEEVNGEWQGAITNFLTGLQCGAIRIDFAPDGSMWVGQTSRVWASKGVNHLVFKESLLTKMLSPLKCIR